MRPFLCIFPALPCTTGMGCRTPTQTIIPLFPALRPPLTLKTSNTNCKSRKLPRVCPAPTMRASSIFLAIFTAAASANHRITLRNNCAFGVGLTLSNFPHQGVDYTGPAIPDIPAKTSHDIIVPTRWNGRICDRPPNSGCQNDCFGGIAFGQAPCSMTEWTFDSANIGGQTDYDISNIQGYSVPQQIIPDSGCSVVTCTSVNCPCNQAYRPGDISGTCGGTGPVDQASRVCGSSGYTVVYCP
ncbi:hypothetical protein DFH08DRAFT_1090251 [Mycena albidolilacea]|uniref:Thaumatin-like protein n=1 Tax=Mycena albidolilacea TaxID=1033008 RepID=A0AAD7E7Y2_9AGAR|nr:hypothetical protein DFH08DRAFT_1090251 [Mycena albidolilacea]